MVHLGWANGDRDRDRDHSESPCQKTQFETTASNGKLAFLNALAELNGRDVNGQAGTMRRIRTHQRRGTGCCTGWGFALLFSEVFGPCRFISYRVRRVRGLIRRDRRLSG